MNKSLLLICLLVFMSAPKLFCQVPYFGTTVGDGKLYGYTSLKVKPGINAQETYTTFQYGINESLAVGTDNYSGVGSNYLGVLLRYGTKLSPYFSIGAQITPSFDVNNNLSYSYTTAALYMSGNINSSLCWCSNTWYGINRSSQNTITQWTYLGYSFALNNGHSITPMVGEIHSWRFDQDVDLALGFYYSIKGWNFYLWGNDFFNKNPRFVIGVDFAL